MKKKMYRAVIVIFTIILAVGMSAYCCLATRSTAKEFAEASEYIINNKVNATDTMKDSYGKGFGAERSFYMGYAFENPNFTEGEFYSEMRNAKGEVVASYKPFLIVKGEIAHGVEDTRVILWDDNAKILYENKRSAGVKVEVKDEGYTKALEELEKCANAYKNSDFWPGEEPTLEIYGTCDDDFIYLEKLVWHTEWGEATYTYMPAENQTASGKMSFESWVNSLNYKKYYVNATNVSGTYYLDEPFENAEAKKMCEELSEKFREETFNVDEIESSSDIKNLETFFVEKVVNIGDGYFVSIVYLCRPLQIACSRLTIKYIGCASLFVAWLAIAVCIILYQKRFSKETSKNVRDDVKEVDSQYEN